MNYGPSAQQCKQIDDEVLVEGSSDEHNTPSQIMFPPSSSGGHNARQLRVGEGAIAIESIDNRRDVGKPLSASTNQLLGGRELKQIR